MLKVIALLLFFLLSPVSVFAQGVTASKPVKVDIQNIQIGGGTVSGKIQVINPNSVAIENAKYIIKLLGQDIVSVGLNNVSNITPGSLITYQNVENLTLPPNNTDLNLSLEYPETLQPGDYKLQISFFTSNDQLIGSISKIVPLSGGGTFLQIRNCVIVTDGVEYDPISGPNVAPKGKISGKCSVVNQSNSTVTAYPQADYSVGSVSDANETEIQKFSGTDAITINARATRNITFPLPEIETPQVYEALAYLQDDKGLIVSPRIAFRWIIAGESSLIRSIVLDKTKYKTGETAKVTVGADPSMDLFWRGGGPTKNSKSITASSSAFVQPKLQGTPLDNPALTVVIKDGKGKICGQKEQKVTANPNQNIWPDQIVDIPMVADCTNPVVAVKVSNNGQELASKEVKVLSMVEKAVDSNNSHTKPWLFVIGGLVLLILVGLGGILYRRRKPKSPPSAPRSPSIPVSAKTVSTGIAVLFLGIMGIKSDGLQAFSFIQPVCAAEYGPGTTPISIHYEGITATRPQACPGPDWLHQPQGPNGSGGCLLGMVSGHDETNFTFLDTQNEITYANNQINAHIAGQFKGYGCGNTQIGLIVRATINGSSADVKINGGGPKAVFNNLGVNGGGGGTNVDLNLAITSATGAFCGPENVKLELIPYIQHAGLVASDMTEDNLIKDADVPGWNSVTYVNRQNCGAAGQSCFGILQKNLIVPCVACGTTCTNAADCAYGVNGCTTCMPNAAGTASSCQPPPACGASCVRDDQCAGATRDGCTECRGGTCKKPPACNDTCTTKDDCEGAKDGCVECRGGTCKKPPACNDTCTTPADCEGAKDGCTDCRGGTCKKPPACGDSCTTKADCASAKDGCSDCLEGTCTDFKENMCKCDGIDSKIVYPSDKFDFTAYAKVMGADAAKAQVQSMQIFMAKNNDVIAKSAVLTPTIAETTSEKVRYKISWSVPPPSQIDPKAIYRVWADIKCKAKKRLPNPTPAAGTLGIQVDSDKRGIFSTIMDYLSSLFGIKNSIFKKQSSIESENVLAATAPSPSVEDNLQLKTLQGVKIVETDSCRFVNFKFDETLF